MDALAGMDFITQSDAAGMLLAPTEGHEVKKDKDVSFKDVVSGFLKNTNELQQNLDQKIQDFATGNLQNAHEVFIAAEKATLSLKMAVALQSKFISAYQEILRTQV